MNVSRFRGFKVSGFGVSGFWFRGFAVSKFLVSEFLVSRFRSFAVRTEDRGQTTKDLAGRCFAEYSRHPLSFVFCLLSYRSSEKNSNFLLRSNPQYDKLLAVHPEKDCPAAGRAERIFVKSNHLARKNK